MGCAMQELQQQTNEPIRMDLTGCYSRVNGPSSPVDLKSSQQKNSQLKESHSALVKILESAPIQRLDKEIILVGGSDGSGSHSGTDTNVTPNNTDNRHHHYRKRNKHLVDMNNCDNHDKSSEDESSSTVEMICPWKKTRIAREWRQKNKEMQEARERQEEKNKFMDLDDDEDDNDKSCECGDVLRRSSSDSIESVQNDSGCDSDCRENITELCKKFDENLSEQDVCMSSKSKKKKQTNKTFSLLNLTDYSSYLPHVNYLKSHLNLNALLDLI